MSLYREVEPAKLTSNIRILESKLFSIISLTFVDFFPLYSEGSSRWNFPREPGGLEPQLGNGNEAYIVGFHPLHRVKTGNSKCMCAIANFCWQRDLTHRLSRAPCKQGP